MQLQLKTILNAIQHFPGFVFQDIRLQRHRDGRPRRIEIAVEPHSGIGAKCSRCLQPAPGYDRLGQRSWLFVPLWGIETFFLFAARRVHCATHGVVVEHIPWSGGKRPVTVAMMCFLARLGAAAFLARDGGSLPDQLGMRVSLSGVVCAVGFGAPTAGRRSSHWGG